jgi:hypothetical protein
MSGGVVPLLWGIARMAKWLHKAIWKEEFLDA